MSSTFTDILNYRLHELKYNDNNLEKISYVIDHKENNIYINNPKEVMEKMKNIILKEVINFDSMKINVKIDFCIHNDNHRTIVSNNYTDEFENYLKNNIEKKYNEIISRSLDIMTNENDFKNHLPDFMEFMRDSKVEFKKKYVNLCSENKFKNFYNSYFNCNRKIYEYFTNNKVIYSYKEFSTTIEN